MTTTKAMHRTSLLMGISTPSEVVLPPGTERTWTWGQKKHDPNKDGVLESGCFDAYWQTWLDKWPDEFDRPEWMHFDIEAGFMAALKQLSPGHPVYDKWIMDANRFKAMAQAAGFDKVSLYNVPPSSLWKPDRLMVPVPAELMEGLDWLLPVAYIHETCYQQEWDRYGDYLKEVVAEGQRFGIPVYAKVWCRWALMKPWSPNRHKLIPQDFWTEMMSMYKDAGITGFCYWDDTYGVWWQCDQGNLPWGVFEAMYGDEMLPCETPLGYVVRVTQSYINILDGIMRPQIAE